VLLAIDVDCEYRDTRRELRKGFSHKHVVAEKGIDFGLGSQFLGHEF
jgi:hypothetical protein